VCYKYSTVIRECSFQLFIPVTHSCCSFLLLIPVAHSCYSFHVACEELNHNTYDPSRFTSSRAAFGDRQQDQWRCFDHSRVLRWLLSFIYLSTVDNSHTTSRSHHENPMSTWYGYLSGDIQAQMSRVTPLLEALGHQFVFVDGLETCDSTEGKSQSITFAYHIRCMGSTWN
jgi:hypothetical protein